MNPGFFTCKSGKRSLANQYYSKGEESAMKIFHINQYKFKLNRDSGKYLGLEKYWGNIITNIANRTEERYAIKFETKGRHISYLSQADFQWFKDKCEHVYDDDLDKYETVTGVFYGFRRFDPKDKVLNYSRIIIASCDDNVSVWRITDRNKGYQELKRYYEQKYGNHHGWTFTDVMIIKYKER